MDVQDVPREAVALANAAVAQASDATRAGNTAEAKRLLTEAQRQIREWKRQVADVEREHRAQFQDARLKVNKSGQALGMIAGSKMRGAMARSRAYDKRKLASRQQDAMAVYRNIKSQLDSVVAQLADAKAKVPAGAGSRSGASRTTATRLSSEATSKADAPPPPPPTPPTWAADPFGRHELRYWNGSSWTAHVSDRGTQSEDPVYGDLALLLAPRVDRSPGAAVLQSVRRCRRSTSRRRRVVHCVRSRWPGGLRTTT